MTKLGIQLSHNIIKVTFFVPPEKNMFTIKNFIWMGTNYTISLRWKKNYKKISITIPKIRK